MKKKKTDAKTYVGYAIIAAILVLLIVIIGCLKSIYYSIEEINPVLDTDYSTTLDEYSIMKAVNKTNNMKDLGGVLKLEDVSMWSIDGEENKEIKLPVKGDIFKNENSPEIRGKLVNKTKNMYTNVEIKYNLYDKDNNIIGVLSDYTDLKGGESVNIEAVDNEKVEVDYNKIHHYKLGSIKGIENK